MNRPPAPTRVFLLALCLVFGAQLGITISLPSLPAIAAELGLDGHKAALSVSLYLLGVSAPLPLWGAAADRWGRARVLQAALATFALSSVALALATDGDLFVALRLVEGIGAGGCAVCGRIVSRDMWQGPELARRFAHLSASYIVSLGGGQFVGARLDALGLWRAEFLVLAAIAAAAALAMRGLKLAPGRAGVRLVDSLRAYPALLRLPAFVAPAMVGAFGYAAVLIFQQSSPFLLVETYGLDATSVGDVGLLTAVAYFAGSLLVARLVRRAGQRAMLVLGAGLTFATGLAGLALAATGHAGAAAFAALFVALMFGQAISFPPSLSIAASASPERGAQATALAGFLQQTFGALMAAAAALAVTAGFAVPVAAAAGFGALALAMAARR